MITTDQLKDFISKYWRYKKHKIEDTTTLDKLGMYGDDKYDFLIAMGKEFNVDMTNFSFDKYVDDEVVDPFGIGEAIRKLFGKKIRKIYPITVQELVDFMNGEKKLDE